jgi:hypothetical protein
MSGCEQKPQPGKLLGLSGSPFSKNSLEITDAPQNLTEKDAGASSSTITTGTIVGIAVGVGLFLIGGIAIIFVYLRKRRMNRGNMFGVGSPRGGKDADSRSSSRTMITNSQPWGQDHKRSGSISSRHSGGRIGSSNSFYEKAEEDGRSRHYNFDPRSKKNNPGSALPTHPAYIPRSLGKDSSTGGSNINNTRGGATPTPSPPATKTNFSKPGTGATESYMLQRYRNAPEIPSNLHNVTTMSPLAAAKDAPQASIIGHVNKLPPPPPRPPPPSQSNPNNNSGIPSITVPSVPRIRAPKKYTPPSIVISTPGPAEERRKGGYKKITQPLNLTQGQGTSEPRFIDRPLQGGPVQAPSAPNYGQEWNARTFEQPMHTGTSEVLYG